MTCGDGDDMLQSRHNETREKKNSGERKTKRRGKGMNMQNDTFNQILNSNLASMDPGFGQFALAKASSDLFKKVINK